MINYVIKFIILRILVVFPIFLFYSGCSLNSSKKVYIDRQFLYDIEKQYIEEGELVEDKDYKFNKTWKHNFFELIYLTSKGDPKAIDVSILLIGQPGYPVGRFEQFDLFAKPTVKSNPSYFWEAIEKTNPKIQSMALYRLLGYYLPKEEVANYLDKHTDVRKLYDEYKKEILRGREKTNSEPDKEGIK